LNSQPQRTRRDWENLFHVEYTGRIGRIVENRDTGNFGNRFFELGGKRLELLSAKVCNAGDVAAGTGKAFNYASLDRIGPTARHNDGNRLGRALGRPDQVVPSCNHDDIDLETRQLGRKLRKPIKLPLRISVLGGNVLSFYVAELAQSQPNCLGTGGLSTSIARR
jgi:hypothetical protein